MREEYKLLLPAVISLAILVAFPTVYLFYTSFHEWLLRDPTGPKFNFFGNYWSLLMDDDFRNSVIVTLVYAGASIALSMALGLALALIFNESFKGRRVMRTLVILPIVLPPVVVGFTWKFLLSSEVGVIGAYLMRLLGFTKISLLGNPTLALLCVILADVWGKTPFTFLIFLAGLQGILPTYYEAAKIDGAGSWALFRHITLPGLKKAFGVALILRAIDAFNSFDTIFVMTKGGPGTATQTLPLLGWKIGFYYFDLGKAAAIGVILLFMTMILSMFFLKRFVE